jgi:hypothetical protein
MSKLYKMEIYEPISVMHPDFEIIRQWLLITKNEIG